MGKVRTRKWESMWNEAPNVESAPPDSIQRVKSMADRLFDTNYITLPPKLVIPPPLLRAEYKHLWVEFGNIPMNPETECIETEWHGFPKGTRGTEVWEWFE